MATSLDFWFDFTCPYAYLASTRVRALADFMKVPCTFQPMLLGGIFRERGTPQNLSSTLSKEKAAHNARDIARWAKLFGKDVRTPPNHPMRSVDALRVTLATSCNEDVIARIYDSYWIQGEDIARPAVLARLVYDAGLDAREVLDRSNSDAVKNELRERTDRALALGIFGAPSFVVDGKELYFGQDRMHMVAGLTEEAFLERVVNAKLGEVRPSRKLELFFDFSSPYAYLGCARAKALAARNGTKIDWQPIFLGGLFRSMKQPDAPILTWSDEKRMYTFRDLVRSAKEAGVPFAFPSQFPVMTVKALRCYLALPEERRDAFMDATFRAYWAEGRDISSDGVLLDLLGADGREVLERTQDPALKADLIARTEKAHARGVFGVPTFIVDERELFWGQDRVPLVERALRA